MQGKVIAWVVLAAAIVGLIVVGAIYCNMRWVPYVPVEHVVERGNH